MAGAGYKLFSTGDVLSASDVNLYLQQQTVMVFASAAARTTALASVLAEGMVTYLKDTDVVEIYTGAAWVSLDDPNAIQNSIVDAKGDIITATADNTPARLAVGTNGQTLVADSTASTGLKWATPAGASASWSQLGVTATTSGTTVTVSGLSGYNQLYISLEGVSASSATASSWVRFNGDGGANYNMSQFTIRNSPVQVAGNYISGGTEINLARIQTATNKMNGGIFVNGANSSGKKFFQGLASCDDDLITVDIVKPNIMGIYDGTSVISSVSIYTSGTAFDAGNIRVYGSVA